MSDSTTARSVLVFGGSRGLGAAVAARFAAAAWRVGVAARDSAALRACAADLGAAALPVDVADAAAVDAAVQAFGPLDAVVNAAAVQGAPGAVGPLWETEPAAFAGVLATNLLGSYHVLRAAIRAMQQQRRAGAVVMFSGGGSTQPRPRVSGYAVSKTGLLRLVESAAAELAAAGIDIGVFALAPGPVHTAMTEQVLAHPEQFGSEENEIARRVVAGEGVPPERAAALCTRLVEPSARPLAGRLIHVAEPLEDYLRAAQSADAGRLRRRDYAV